MANSFGVVLKEKLIKSGLVNAYDGEPIRGCTPDEIEALKNYQGVDYIPEIYYQFLLELGRGAGKLFRGSDYSYKYLPHLREDAKILFSEHKPPLLLPDDAFVFFGHQGYIYYYFHTGNREDDPAVYSYQEGDSQVIRISDSLSQFYNKAIENLGRP
jgi:hypothetical protein